MQSHEWTSILFALPEEAAPFVKRLQQRDGGRGVGKPMLYTSSTQQVTVYVSGSGMARAGAIAEYIVETERRPHRLILCGFAGGLHPSVKPGDLVIADRVLNGLTGESYQPDAPFMALAEAVSSPTLSVHKGTLFTNRQVLCTPQEKRQTGEWTQGLMVDMETATAVKAAEKGGVPWLAVRAITDGLEDTMPLDFNALMDADSQLKRRRVVKATLRQPWKIPALMQLGRRSALAAQHLALYLDTLLQK